MIHWLYRYIFRGIGIVFVVGMLTILGLAILSQYHSVTHRPAAAARARRP